MKHHYYYYYNYYLPYLENAVEPQRIRLELEFQDRDVNLQDISSLFYDLNLAYDFSILTTHPDYFDYTFNRFFWYRNGRPIGEEQKMGVARISKESPLTLALVIVATASAFKSLEAFLKLVDKVWDIKIKALDYEKKKLEIEKLKREIDLENHNVESQIINGDQDQIMQSLLRRLKSSNIKLKIITISLEDVNREGNN